VPCVCHTFGLPLISLFLFLYSYILAPLVLKLPAYEPQNAALPNKSILFMQNGHAKGFSTRPLARFSDFP